MDRLELIKQPISAEFEVFKQKFDASLQSSNPLLDEVIKFIKQRKGKMMRPLLALLMAKLFGEIGDSTYYAAISLTGNVNIFSCLTSDTTSIKIF